VPMSGINTLKRILEIFLLYLNDIPALLQKKESGKAILLIRLDEIGDFILWLDTAKEYRKLYPKSKIILLGNKIWTDLAKQLPYWDEVLQLDCRKFIRNPFYRLRWLISIRKIGFRVAINPTFSRNFLLGDSIIHSCGAKEKIGFAGDRDDNNYLQKRIADRWYTHLIPAMDNKQMELQRNAEFLRGLGIINFKAHLPSLPVLESSPDLINKLPDEYYVLIPGARTSNRRWPFTSFVELTEKVFQQTGMIGVVCGASNEKKVSFKIVQASSAQLLDFTGRTSLAQLVEVIRRGSLLIGNETAGIHIAAAVNTPSICILGGGHYARFIPYDIGSRNNKTLPLSIIHQMDCFGCNWRCRYPYKEGGLVPCIEKIPVDEVFAACESLIKNCNNRFDVT
jgi:ADP-heptose:LPS heptosyltransferase